VDASFSSPLHCVVVDFFLGRLFLRRFFLLGSSDESRWFPWLISGVGNDIISVASLARFLSVSFPFTMDNEVMGVMELVGRSDSVEYLLTCNFVDFSSESPLLDCIISCCRRILFDFLLLAIGIRRMSNRKP
jgi:hypothetical protein